MSTPWRIALSVLAVGLSIFYVFTDSPQLGLDLEGGTQVVLDLQPRDGREITASTANSTVEILRKRVDGLGVSEPNIEAAGNKRVIVELPGLTDKDRALEVIGKTAQLSFHRVQANLGQAPPTTTTSIPGDGGAPTTVAPPTTAPQSPSTTSAGLGEAPDNRVLGQAQEPPPSTTPATPAPAPAPGASGDGTLSLPDENGQLLQLGPAALTGEGVANAIAQPPDPNNAQWYVEVEFKGAGKSAWTKLTGEAACAPSGDPTRQVAIVLDQQIISHPQVSSEGSTPVQCNVGITGDKTQITGSFTSQEAKNLALLIRGGALPVDVKVASTSVVGPELGDQAIEASYKAVIIGGILTVLYILLYYRVLGLLAGIALAAYSVISFALLLGLNLTLTLPGIAGFVLAIAMATDSNILVYERAKEELDNGRSMKAAGKTGFKNALSAIIDSNATTFIAALTLFLLAVGEVRGFAVTLLVGTAVSIFVTLVVLRTLVTGLLSMEWARNRPRLLGMYVGKKFRDRMAHNPPNIIGFSKYFLVFALLVTIACVSGIFIRGVNYGIEFTGGRLLEYSTAQTVNLDDARTKMGEIGFPRAIVQRSGTDDTSLRVPDVNAEELNRINEAMKELGGGSAERLRDETVSGTFSNELKRKAAIGLIIGVAAQLAWVAWRFRWTFGVGAVLAMVHDALLVFGLWAWLQKPFDAVFLAAMLTIIAFSVNDSVVIFDRIREQRRRRGGETFERVVNDACAVTFPRTINIALSALFILGALYAFGGQTLSDFGLALVLGIVTGIYSSVFIAASVAVYLERWKPTVSGRMAAGRAKPSRARAAATVGAGSNGSPTEADESEGDETPRPVASRPAPRPRKKSSKKRR